MTDEQPPPDPTSPPPSEPGWGAPPPPPPPPPLPAGGPPQNPPGWGQTPYGQVPPQNPPGWGQPQYGQPQYGVPQFGPQFASFGARLGAILLDGLITTVPLVIAVIVLLRAGPHHITTCTINGADRLCNVPTGGSILLVVFLAIAAYVLLLIFYYGGPLGRTGQTIGKRATGVRVLDAATGQPIGTGRAVGRQLFAQFISGSICDLGYFWMLWDPQKQTWHDKIIGSVVVKA